MSHNSQQTEAVPPFAPPAGYATVAGYSPRLKAPPEYTNVLVHTLTDTWRVLWRKGNGWEYIERDGGELKHVTLPANSVIRWWPLPDPAVYRKMPCASVYESHNEVAERRAQQKGDNDE